VKSARQPADAIPQLKVSKASQIAIDNFLLRRLNKRRVEQLFD
jgi:hypothetical protein